MEIVGFEEVRDAVLGSLAPELGPAGSSAHRHGLKVWFAESKREHYEAQVVKVEGEAVLEIGFHAEHPKASENDAAVALLAASEARWRSRLGDDAVLGPFLGRAGWTRVSETWPPPRFEDIDEVIEIAARLVDYIDALEPVRRAP